MKGGGGLFGKQPQPKEETRLSNIDPARTPTNEAARPLPLFWGKRRLGMTFITKEFDEKFEDIEETYVTGGGKGGSQTSTRVVGHDVYASYAAALCLGPVHGLREIWFDGRKLWEGTLRSTDSGHSDSDGSFTFEDEFDDLGNNRSGKLQFYWGKTKQTQNAAVAEEFGAASTPAWRRICYVVADQLLWGRDRYTAPALEFTLERHTRALAGLVPTFSPVMDQHDNCALVEVIYDLMTDQVYGMGIPKEMVDHDSFVGVHELMETHFGGAVGVSPLYTGSISARQAIADLCQYANCVVRQKNGKFSLALGAYRSKNVTPPAAEIWTPDFVGEPEVHREGWGSTWNTTRVSFTDRELDYGDDVVTVADMGHEAYFRAPVQREFQRPHVTKFAEAIRQAREIQSRGAVPQMRIRMKIKSHGVWEPSTILQSAGQQIHAGDLIRIQAPEGYSDRIGYQKLGIVNAVLIVRRMEIGGPRAPGATLDCEVFEETLRVDLDGSSLDPGGITQEPEVATPTMLIGVPTKRMIKDSLRRDGMVCCVARGDQRTDAYRVYISWNKKGGGTPQNRPIPYPTPIFDGTSFAKEITINRWKITKRIEENPERALVDFTFRHAFDDAWFQNTTRDGIHLCSQSWRMRVNGEKIGHSVECSWFVLFGGFQRRIAERRWLVEFDMDDEDIEDPEYEADKRAAYRSREWKYASGSKIGRYPCTTAFIGRLRDFGIFYNSAFGLRRQRRTYPQGDFTRTFQATAINSTGFGEATTKETSLRRKATSQAFPDGMGVLGEQWGNPVKPQAVAFFAGDDLGRYEQIPTS